MKKIEISQNVFQYSFKSEGRSFIDNIFVVINNSKALIIDTAFEDNARLVLDDLKKNNVEPETVIISHLHEDHFMGNKIFKDCNYLVHPIYYSQVKYRDILKSAFLDLYGISMVSHNDILDFYGSKIKIYFAPGHHISAITIVIDDKYLIANDLILFTSDNKNVIPFLDSSSSVEQYLSSLKQILNLDPQILLTGHGYPINNKDIYNVVNERIYYLEKLLEINENADINEFLLNGTENYSHLGFHMANLQKIYKSA